MYKERTSNIEVMVIPAYLEDQSEPGEAYYAWAYFVRIRNVGAETVQLLNRHWEITDSNGVIQEVDGPGVIGQQPTLGPGETFEYASGTFLRTPSGIMGGTYEMMNEDGRHFNVVIPTFSLDSPEQLQRPN
ncbi:MAG: Co2+/Mg2+ efflux protein ApaG [Hyphomicrobiales bacterium]|nr:Co2+/Mg2+ efflux protein ApaG [Rickettsiales bacterium]MCP5361396.1 Co2+/Mg2+ efflux protein ApaG [Hyphomicrobiales bacterium]